MIPKTGIGRLLYLQELEKRLGRVQAAKESFIITSSVEPLQEEWEALYKAATGLLPPIPPGAKLIWRNPPSRNRLFMTAFDIGTESSGIIYACDPGITSKRVSTAEILADGTFQINGGGEESELSWSSDTTYMEASFTATVQTLTGTPTIQLALEFGGLHGTIPQNVSGILGSQAPGYVFRNFVTTGADTFQEENLVTSDSQIVLSQAVTVPASGYSVYLVKMSFYNPYGDAGGVPVGTTIVVSVWSENDPTGIQKSVFRQENNMGLASPIHFVFNQTGGTADVVFSGMVISYE